MPVPEAFDLKAILPSGNNEIQHYTIRVPQHPSNPLCNWTAFGWLQAFAVAQEFFKEAVSRDVAKIQSQGGSHQNRPIVIH